VGGSSLRVAHGKYALAAVLGGALRRIRAAINKWNTPVKLILSQMGPNHGVLELTELLGSVEELVRVPYCVFRSTLLRKAGGGQQGRPRMVHEYTNEAGAAKPAFNLQFSTFKPGTFNPPKLGIDFDSKMLYSD
jgi:hypothetical protein